MKIMKTNLKYFLSLLFFAFLWSACYKSDDTSDPNTNEVYMQNNMFNPGTIIVSVNTTVKWTNKDGNAHTVTSNSASFDSGSISNSRTYSHSFTAVGTYPYKCTLHSNMTGTVVVQ